MGIEVTDEAADVLNRSLEMSKIDRRTGGVRLRTARGLGGKTDMQVELADGPLEGETTVETKGVRIFVDAELGAAMSDAIVALEPQHETIVIRRASEPGLS